MKRSKSIEATGVGHGEPGQPTFDMCRLTQAAKIAHMSVDSIRGMFKRGLRGYRHGRMVFVSLRELAEFIRSHAEKNPTLVGITKRKAA
ncbi:MAG: hypothetical protein QOF48_1743 [Verrucomicrobiota bacterium]|jgi:hypothetical protein